MLRFFIRFTALPVRSNPHLSMCVFCSLWWFCNLLLLFLYYLLSFSSFGQQGVVNPPATWLFFQFMIFALKGIKMKGDFRCWDTIIQHFGRIWTELLKLIVFLSKGTNACAPFPLSRQSRGGCSQRLHTLESSYCEQWLTIYTTSRTTKTEGAAQWNTITYLWSQFVHHCPLNVPTFVSKFGHD